MKNKYLYLFLCILVAPPLMAVEALKPVDTPELGQVNFYVPAQTAQGFAFVFSGNEGFTEQDRSAIAGLTGEGVVVAAIDTQSALKKLNQTDAQQNCVYLPGPLEYLAHNAQADLKLSNYIEPILLGRGAGASLVYVALAQAPPLAFAGGLSADFKPTLSLARKLCNLEVSVDDKGSIGLAPDYALRGTWVIGATATLSDDLKVFAQKASQVNANTPVEILGPKDLPALYREVIVALAKKSYAGDKAQSVADLPLVEVSNNVKNKTLIIIYSGDGGWRDIDRMLGDLFAKRDYAVIGVDALRYFWSKRSSEELAKDLARIIQHYRSAWAIERVVLVGYSFGADILPFAYNRLSRHEQGLVTLLSLLAPGRAADFEIKVSGWLGAGSSADAVPILPEIAKIDTAKIQCIFGDEEAEESLCTAQELLKTEIIKRSGGHHFDEDYTALADVISNGITRRLNHPNHAGTAVKPNPSAEAAP
jgi:type IV secretory pathway VirJ component